jgi:hypothetical protein
MYGVSFMSPDPLTRFARAQQQSEYGWDKENEFLGPKQSSQRAAPARKSLALSTHHGRETLRAPLSPVPSASHRTFSTTDHSSASVVSTVSSVTSSSVTHVSESVSVETVANTFCFSPVVSSIAIPVIEKPEAASACLVNAADDDYSRWLAQQALDLASLCDFATDVFTDVHEERNIDWWETRQLVHMDMGDYDDFGIDELFAAGIPELQKASAQKTRSLPSSPSKTQPTNGLSLVCTPYRRVMHRMKGGFTPSIHETRFYLPATPCLDKAPVDDRNVRLANLIPFGDEEDALCLHEQQTLRELEIADAQAEKERMMSALLDAWDIGCLPVEHAGPAASVPKSHRDGKDAAPTSVPQAAGHSADRGAKDGKKANAKGAKSSKCSIM